MALCTICSSFDIYFILLGPEKNWPESLGPGEGEYYWHEKTEALCFRHYFRISTVRQSASAGCQLCNIIWGAFESRSAKVYDIASDLPLVLHEGARSQIKVSFVSHEEGLVTLCVLDISIGNSESSFAMPVLSAL